MLKIFERTFLCYIIEDPAAQVRAWCRLQRMGRGGEETRGEKRGVKRGVKRGGPYFPHRNVWLYKAWKCAPPPLHHTQSALNNAVVPLALLPRLSESD